MFIYLGVDPPNPKYRVGETLPTPKQRLGKTL